MSSDHDAGQPSGQEIHGERDVYAAGRNLSVHNYFGAVEQYSVDPAAPVSGRGGHGRSQEYLPSRSAADWNPFSLGVHRAIQAPGAVRDDLPEFVVRPHDHVLRAEVASAAAGPKLVMLVGSSSTGKTRSAVEAVQSVLPDWPLLYPLTASELTALVRGRRVGGTSILWLNETQVYVDSNGGADAAAALRGLLAGGQPVLVVGTLWPEYWLTYMRPPEFGAPDPYPQARQLLETAVKIDVPDHFTESDLAQARKIAADDPRLAVALSSEGRHGVTQILAGGPDLVDRWRNAPDPYSRAVITAAVDARRLGHLGILRAELLRAAAAAYLDGPQRAAAPSGWFTESLTYAGKPVKGAIAPLSATSQAVGQIDGYLLADYLDQFGRASRLHTPVPDALWTALASHTRTGADLNRIGTAAVNRGRYEHAASLWTAASQAGDMTMAMPLRRLLAHVGHHAKAEQALRRAAEAGDPEGLTRLTSMLQREARHHELEQVLQQAAAAGLHQAAHDLAVLLSRAGRGNEAAQVLQQAIATGDPYGQHLLDILLERTSEPGPAADPAPPYAQALPSPQPSVPVQQAARASTDLDRSSARTQRASNEADAEAPGRRKETPRRRNFNARAEPDPPGQMSLRMRYIMEIEKKLQALGAAREEGQAGGAPGHACESPMAYWRRRQAQTEHSLRELTRGGDVDAGRELAVFMIATGRLTEGEHLLRTATSAAGDAASLRLLTEVLVQTGRQQEASMLARYGLAEDGTTAPAW